MITRRQGASVFKAEKVSLGRRGFLSLGCACCAMVALKGSAAFAQQTPQVEAHLEAARRAAGTDLRTYLRLADQVKSISGLPSVTIEALRAMPTPEPARVFDNLFFIGNSWVSCWVIATPDGMILVDAMDNSTEAEQIIEGGLRKLGLNPAAIKTILVTHGHGDHYGGAAYLKAKYGASIAMSEPDWVLTETKLDMDLPDWGRPPKRDISLKDGDVVSVGDTKVDILLTAGHTPGTISLAFDVKDGAKTHRALLWGGTAFNFAERADRMDRIQAYIASTERVRDLAARQSMDVFISNHDVFDGAIAKIASLRPGAPNPFVAGTETTRRILTVMNECAQATALAWRG